MPNLHELFDAASDGLPPLPDLAPTARRIVRQRRLATRSAAAALSSALVIGAGTFVLSGQHVGGVANTASGTPRTFSAQYVLDTLRSLWPISGQHLDYVPESGQATIVISEGGHEVGQMFFEVSPDASQFPNVLTCWYGGPGADCVRTKAADGDQVLAEVAAATPVAIGSLPAATGPASSPPPVGATSSPPPVGATASPPPNGATASPPPATDSKVANAWATPAPGSARLNVSARAYRLHGTSLGQLTVILGQGSLPTKQQMLTLVEATAYEQLIESAAAAGSFAWLGTPPATATASGGATQTPTAPYSSAPSNPSSPEASVTPPRGSDSAQPPASP
ncbi:MAG TPA: hypothetical protein VFU65_09750 [Actinocrinis sp.]|nr:hypothetical protein [Actinocrinis sp.]